MIVKWDAADGKDRGFDFAIIKLAKLARGLARGGL
jgi:hypothetical protein